MSQELQPAFDLKTELTKFQKVEETLKEMQERFKGLNAVEDYEGTRKAIGELRTFRTSLEKTRKQLKEPALEFGRQVDSIAKDLTAKASATETPLQLSKDTVDEEKEREKQAKADAQRKAIEEAARLKAEADQTIRQRELDEQREAMKKEQAEAQAAAAKLRVEREAFEREQAERKAFQEKAEAALKAENDRKEAERQAELKRFQEEQAAARKKIDDERRAMEAERKKLEDEKAIRQWQEESERLAANKKADDEKRLADLEANLERLRPDRQKLVTFASRIRLLKQVNVQSDEARAALDEAVADMAKIAERLETWEPKL